MDNNLDFSKNCRILLIWDISKVQVSVIKRHEQYLHCKVQLRDMHWSGFITFVYALNGVSQRVCLWTDIVALSSQIGVPRMVAGDLNTVRDQYEKWSETRDDVVVGTKLLDMLSLPPTCQRQVG